MIIGYVRVSTVEQNEARQLVTMEKYNVEKIFQEKVSAKDLNRPKLEEMMDYVREGDIVVVHDFSRLARSTKDLLNIVEFLNNKKVHLISSKENIDSSTPTGKLMLTMIGAINEFERSNLLERQKEGIVIAKSLGKYKGRKKVHIDNFEEYYNRYMCRDASKSQIAKELNISRPTLDRIIYEYKKEND
ncbi:recombinase family protein [Paraclostridium sordellii]|uniref:recombinase family protein n=1 Tax=Paraclostridium sordellii TaxID=1505 RepID=UPI000540DA79|nr:recombinase family protein [Paeniclostridium sordellii]AUO31850.1 recombinase family protein [Paeniclostridium sordellii]CEK36635.1 transposon Tn21 resolvase,DNA-invertase hin,multiple promoter invertase,Resolvase, N terminal domain (plasmid) [[Clostridium] sordellii] [Paeniclostridium sordellii]CEP45922.1 transposon Tn21 resolvase [[Clostridium] sordellii] [Paeniclostridium sordellii]